MVLFYPLSRLLFIGRYKKNSDNSACYFKRGYFPLDLFKIIWWEIFAEECVINMFKSGDYFGCKTVMNRMSEEDKIIYRLEKGDIKITDLKKENYSMRLWKPGRFYVGLNTHMIPNEYFTNTDFRRRYILSYGGSNMLRVPKNTFWKEDTTWFINEAKRNVGLFWSISDEYLNKEIAEASLENERLSYRAIYKFFGIDKAFECLTQYYRDPRTVILPDEMLRDPRYKEFEKKCNDRREFGIKMIREANEQGNTREFWLKALKVYGVNVGYVPKHLCDRELYMEAIKIDGFNANFVPHELWDKEMAMLVVQDNNCYNYGSIPLQLKLDTDILKRMLKRKLCYFADMPNNIQLSKDDCEEIIMENPNAIFSMPNNLWDGEMLKKSIRKSKENANNVAKISLKEKLDEGSVLDDIYVDLLIYSDFPEKILSEPRVREIMQQHWKQILRENWKIIENVPECIVTEEMIKYAAVKRHFDVNKTKKNIQK